MRLDGVSSKFGERGAIDQLELAALPADRVRRVKTLERLVGVHRRHAERVGEMLLIDAIARALLAR